jgi:hypothetical protein
MAGWRRQVGEKEPALGGYRTSISLRYSPRIVHEGDPCVLPLHLRHIKLNFLPDTPIRVTEILNLKCRYFANSHASPMCHQQYEPVPRWVRIARRAIQDPTKLFVCGAPFYDPAS